MQRKIFSGRTAALVICTILSAVCAVVLFVSLSSRDVVYSLFADTKMVVEVRAKATENIIEMNRHLSQIPGVIGVEYHEGKATQKQLSTDLNLGIEGFMGNQTILPDTFVLTIGGTTLLREGGITDITTALSTTPWVGGHHYDSGLTAEIRSGFQRITDVALFLAMAVGITAILVYYLSLYISIGALFNCYPPAAHHSLGAQVQRWAWVHGALSAIIGGGVVAAVVAIVGMQNPMLGLGTGNLPLILCLLLVGSVVVSQVCTYIILMFKK